MVKLAWVSMKNGNEYNSIIVYAEDRTAAMRLAFDEHCADFDDVVEVRRETNFDPYEGKDLPLEALLAAKWAVPCENCNDSGDDPEYYPEDWSIIDGRAYCQSCISEMRSPANE